MKKTEDAEEKCVFLFQIIIPYCSSLQCGQWMKSSKPRPPSRHTSNPPSLKLHLQEPRVLSNSESTEWEQGGSVVRKPGCHTINDQSSKLGCCLSERAKVAGESQRSRD